MVGSTCKKLNYCSSEKFDKYNNKFVKGWSPGSNLLNVTDTSSLPTIKMDISYQPFIKDDIFEATVYFPPRGTPIVIINCYCEHHNMTNISQSNNNIP